MQVYGLFVAYRFGRWFVVPSWPNTIFNVICKEKGWEYVSVSNSVDCCFVVFHRSHRFLFLPSTCSFAMLHRQRGRTVAADAGTTLKWSLRPKQACVELRSGRSAESNISLAVRPYIVLAQGGNWRNCVVAISSRPVVVGRVGE